MQIVDEGLATVDLARAYQVEDVLLVRASGTKPTACHVVALEQSLLDVEPPAFVARVSTDPRVRCTTDSAPFEEHRAFRVGTLRPQVLVRHSGGELTVDVEDLTSDIEAIGAALTIKLAALSSALGTRPTRRSAIRSTRPWRGHARSYGAAPLTGLGDPRLAGELHGRVDRRRGGRDRRFQPLDRAGVGLASARGHG